jgi:hypothetical protein
MILHIASGEFLLRRWPNSGGIVLLRSIWISTALFLLAIGAYSYLDPFAVLKFSSEECAKIIRANFAWYGAMLGGVYAALYSRYSSQWQYLAGLYNQLMAAEDARPRGTLEGPERRRRVLWWHAFIADAQDLHLSLKPSFATAIWYLLREKDIAEIERGSSESDLRKFARFEKNLKRVAKILAAEVLPTQSAS